MLYLGDKDYIFSTVHKPIQVKIADSGNATIQAEKRYSRHKIGGTVTVEGVPQKRMVVAIDRRTFSFVYATTSHPETGEWAMEGLEELPERSLMVFAVDSEGKYNAEVADFISQVATATKPVDEAEEE